MNTMQKRLNSRDWILYSLVIFLVLLLLLVMYQVDRQWAKLDQMETALSEQANDMRAMRAKLESGALVASSGQVAEQGSGGASGSGVSPAFKRAYQATQKADYAQGDWSVAFFGTNLKTLTPLVSSDAYSNQVQSTVLETLLTRDPVSLNWQGLIAKSWAISDDGLKVTFQLRNDVFFSDGTPLTAEDVQFTYDFFMNEAIQAPGTRAFYGGAISGVEATGKYEVVFSYEKPYFQALAIAGSIQILPKHFYEPYLEKPQEYNESKAILLGSGPYRLESPKEWTPDKGTVELVRNERYWGEVQPSYDRLLWKIIQNETAQLTTYRNGDIDGYGVYPDSAKPDEYEKLKQDPQIKEKSNVFNYMPMATGYYYIAWNQQREGEKTFFSDPNVRLAMTYLTDRQRIVDDVYMGYAEPAISPFSPRSKQHDTALQPRQFDLEKAKALLKEAGLEDRDGNGVIENQAGVPFEFELTYFESNTVTKQMVLLLRDIYALAGIKMIPSPQEFPVMLDAMKNRTFDAITLGWSSNIETDLYQIFHSKHIEDNGDNFVSYISPELDQLIDEARATVDEEKRMAIWRKAEKVLYDDQPYTFLFRKQTLSFYDKKIQNLELTKVGLNDGFLPAEVYVPTALQKHTD